MIARYTGLVERSDAIEKKPESSSCENLFLSEHRPFTLSK
jgi:hypothetical protein